MNCYFRFLHQWGDTAARDARAEFNPSWPSPATDRNEQQWR